MKIIKTCITIFELLILTLVCPIAFIANFLSNWLERFAFERLLAISKRHSLREPQLKFENINRYIRARNETEKSMNRMLWKQNSN